MSFKKSCLLFLGLASLVSGCGDKNPDQVAADLRAAPKMNGTWSSECQKVDIPGLGLGYKEQLNFAFNDFEFKKYYFASADCGSNQLAVVIQNGTVERTGASSRVNGAEEVNFKFSKVVIQADNEAGRHVLNGLRVCGVSDFPVGKGVEVTSVSSQLNCPVGGEVPRTTYDIVYIQDNKLFLGGHADPRKPELRPQAVDSGRAYIKQ